MGRRDVPSWRPWELSSENQQTDNFIHPIGVAEVSQKAPEPLRKAFLLTLCFIQRRSEFLCWVTQDQIGMTGDFRVDGDCHHLGVPAQRPIAVTNAQPRGNGTRLGCLSPTSQIRKI